MELSYAEQALILLIRRLGIHPQNVIDTLERERPETKTDSVEEGPMETTVRQGVQFNTNTVGYPGTVKGY